MYFTTAMVNALLYPGRGIHRDSMFHENISYWHMPLLGHEMERGQATLQTEEVSAQWQCHRCSSTSRDSTSGLQHGKLTNTVRWSANAGRHWGLDCQHVQPDRTCRDNLPCCQGCRWLVWRKAVPPCLHGPPGKPGVGG